MERSRRTGAAGARDRRPSSGAGAVSQAALSPTAGSPDGFLRWANHRSEAVRLARSARLRVLLGTLAVPPAQTTETLVAQLRRRLANPSADELWLTLAVLTATLPAPSAVERAM